MIKIHPIGMDSAIAVIHKLCVCFFVFISCGMKLNLDYLLEQLWEYLALNCLYTKKRGGMLFHIYSYYIYFHN